MQKTDAEWKAELDPAVYAVLREKGTERAGSGEYNKFYPKEGHFVCAGCETPLYSAQAKVGRSARRRKNSIGFHFFRFSFSSF